MAKKLSLGVKLSYGICDLGQMVCLAVIMFLLLNFLTDTVGLGAALAGLVLMGGRLVDAFYDPLIGYISDRTVTKMGRRRPFMLAAIVPLCIAFIILFTNPSLILGAGISQTVLFAFALLIYIIVSLAASTVVIPYSAMVPELTSDYNERSSINGFRFVFAILGQILAFGSALAIIALCKDKSVGFVLMGSIFAVLILVTALITIFTVKEPTTLYPATSLGFWRSYEEVFKNKPFILALLTWVIHMIAIAITSGINIYYFKYVLKAESMVSIGLLLMVVATMIFVTVSVALSKKLGKKNTYILGLFGNALTLIALFFFGHFMGMTFVLVLLILQGMFFGLCLVPPLSMVADTVDFGYLKGGARREGAYFGIFWWGQKLGQALAGVLTDGYNT